MIAYIDCYTNSKFIVRNLKCESQQIIKVLSGGKEENHKKPLRG